MRLKFLLRFWRERCVYLSKSSLSVSQFKLPNQLPHHCAGGMQIDDHWKIVGTGFNTDPQDAMEPDGRHAGIPFVVGARRVSSAVAGTDQEVHSATAAARAYYCLQTPSLYS
jgi:hypothetical protein